MAVIQGKLVELFQEDAWGLGGRVACPGQVRFAPGQYFQGNRPLGRDRLPATLFPLDWQEGLLELAPPLPADWAVGVELALRGPLGRGFHLPAGARRVALAVLPADEREAEGALVVRLLPLVRAALAQQADVAFYTDAPAARLPRAVEVPPLSALPEALTWADYLALDVPPEQSNRLRQWLGLAPGAACPCPVEVLVAGDFPCGGLAECGVCALETRHGWKLACKDGPVFSLNDLEKR